MSFKLIGSILLIVGTSIGAGMLGLPIATAQLGFVGSLILLFICWAIMTAGALLLLEVNLWLPHNTNVISMARATLGPLGQIIAWLTYFLLLYSLLCAYISGGSGLLQNLLGMRDIVIPAWVSAVLFTLLFGLVIYQGIRSVDYVNRGLMIIKFAAFFVLAYLLLPFISSTNLAAGRLQHMTSSTAVTVTITSFGYAGIVPTLRMYFGGDLKKLKIAIFVGSIIPLICYIIWDAVIMGVIPLNGEHGLISVLHAANSTSALVNTLRASASGHAITFFAKLFTSVCVLTSFLAVGLCVTDFLADAMQMEKKGMSNVFIHLGTFVPPLMIVLFFPNIFIKALEYAGIDCIILLALLPAWMTWHGRYHRHIAKGFRVMGGKVLLSVVILFSVIVVITSIVSISVI